MILVVRRTYRQEAAMGQSLIYQINVFSAKFSFCPKVSVLMCLCVDQASYMADSETWRPQLMSYLGQCTEGPTLHRAGPTIRPCALPPPVSHYYNTKRRPFPLRGPLVVILNSIYKKQAFRKYYNQQHLCFVFYGPNLQFEKVTLGTAR